MPKVGDKILDVRELSPPQLLHMPNEELRVVAQNLLALAQEDRKEMQLLYYEPASPKARDIHGSTARLVGTGGGNGSGKTETHLVEMIALATGVIPFSVEKDLKPKFRGPINCRVVCQSLTNTLEQVILPKLRFDRWTGVDMPGGDRGHWGWIPRFCLVQGSWKRSWSAKNRVLTVVCRNPDNLNEVLGQSTIQFMSHDQEPQDFASGDYHETLLDEPPRFAIYRECQARAMRAKGRIRLAMTWPDDPSIPVDWIFDEWYEPAQPGPNKDPDKDWFDLWTTENKNLDQESVEAQMKDWSEDMKAIRIFGQPIRFSNRIHPLFTNRPLTWSFQAGKVVNPVNGRCPITGSTALAEFNHVQNFPVHPEWPVIWILDPHPRKPHMYMWVQVDPKDDWWVVADGEMEDDPVAVAEEVRGFEERFGLNVKLRLIDPNMGRSPSGVRREVTWQDEFRNAGLSCDCADDSGVGRQRVNKLLEPDRYTKQPRLVIHERCTSTIYQMSRYTWDEHKRADEKDLKQKPRTRYDDYPTMLKYLANFEPDFKKLVESGRWWRRKRRSAA
ncbi:MAG: hypothetical protein MJA83_06075 [Gammaproteobacteria bacterium]|nr:hypothetical protein [Gammaproteobacteria bacterium]